MCARGGNTQGMTKLGEGGNLPPLVLPFAAFLAAIVLLWNSAVSATDLAILAVMYVVTGLGVTVGFHRLLTHRSFQAPKPLEYIFAILGSMAVQGPVMSWVADHRKHHAHADEEGDPHSPHDGHARRRGQRPALGRARADLPRAPHHLERQFGVPLPGHAPLPDRRPLDQC